MASTQKFQKPLEKFVLIKILYKIYYPEKSLKHFFNKI